MKRYISVGLALLVLFPTISYAVWWNPTTWFEAESAANVSVSETAPVASPEITSITHEKIVEKIVEKPVDKIIYRDVYKDKIVADPVYVEENAQLKLKISELETALKNKDFELSQCTLNLGNSNTKITDCNNAKNAYNIAKEKKTELMRLKSAEIEKVQNTLGTVSGLTGNIVYINRKYTDLLIPIDLEIENASHEIGLYCK